ncbi:MAG: MerR family transcriptional regulator [Catalinimonas sp.]
MSTYSIKDLEHLSGIKAHTLRVWEQRYNIVNPKRTDTNIRYYDVEDLKLVLNISLLNEHGFKISKIARMTPDAMQREITSLTQRSNTYSDQIQALTVSMIDLDEERFEKTMATNILQHGFEKTMLNVIYPFLHKIGLLWQTGAVNPAQEHFITYLIRQKLIVAIDGQLAHSHSGQKKFILFLPDGELHELSLLFANFLVRSRQHKVIYLGQSMPYEDVVEAHRIHEPEYIFSIITTMPGPSDIQAYVDRLGGGFPGSTVLLTGFQVVGQDLQVPDNVRILNRMDELIELLEA